jgi:hypothetical protein
MKRFLVAMALGAAALPAAAEPVKLSDAQLDEVTAGDHGGDALAFAGALAHDHGGHGGDRGRGAAAGGQAPLTMEQINFIIKDVRLTFNIQNSNVNLATVLQLAFGGQPTQNGTAAAFQTAVH